MTTAVYSVKGDFLKPLSRPQSVCVWHQIDILRVQHLKMPTAWGFEYQYQFQCQPHLRLFTNTSVSWRSETSQQITAVGQRLKCDIKEKWELHQEDDRASCNKRRPKDKKKGNTEVSWRGSFRFPVCVGQQHTLKFWDRSQQNALLKMKRPY